MVATAPPSITPPGRIAALRRVVLDLGHDLESQVGGLGSAGHPAGSIGDDNYEPAEDMAEGESVLRPAAGGCVVVAIWNDIASTTNEEAARQPPVGPGVLSRSAPGLALRRRPPSETAQVRISIEVTTAWGSRCSRRVLRSLRG